MFYVVHILKPPCVKNDSIATFYAFVSRSTPRWPWSSGSPRAVHTGSTQDHSRLKQLQQQDPSAQSTQPTTAGEGQLRQPTRPSSSTEHQADSSTAEPQLIAYCESQGRPLVPRLGTQLWHATFSGNVPTQWWQDTSSTTSITNMQQEDADSAAGTSSSTTNAASSYRPASWSELCQSSSYIHKHFRWVPSRRMSPFATPQPFPVQLSGYISPYRPRPRAEVNRLAYAEQLHRALMGNPSRVPRRFRAAYTHRQTLRLRLQQESLGLQLHNSTAVPSTHSVPAFKAGQGPISPQTSFPVRHQTTGKSQQQQQVWQQAHQQQQQQDRDWRQQQWQLHDAASDPPLLTWRQFQLAQQRRCRLRSHHVATTTLTWQQFTRRLGVTAAAAPRSQSNSPWMQDRRSDSSSSSPSQPSSALDAAPAAYQMAVKLAGVPAVCPAGSLNPSQTHSGRARRCVAQRDAAGNLVPLPAMCIGAGCSSSSSSSSSNSSSMDTHAGSEQQPPSSSSHDGSSSCSDNLSSRCLAGIGCHHVAQPVLLEQPAKEQPTEEQPAEEQPAPGIGRRRLWGRRWLHGSRAPAAGAEQQPARGPGGSSSSRGAGQGRNALRNSSSGLSMLCPSCAAKPGALAHALRQQMDHQLSPWHRPLGPDCCAMCGCPAPSQQRPSGPSAAALHDWPQGVVLAGVVVAPGFPGRHGEQLFMPHSGAAMHPDSIPTADADSSDDSSYSSDEDGDDYEDHGYDDDDDDSYSDTDSDDEEEDEDDGPSAEVIAAQAAPYTFRNQHDIIYGFWSKCPLG